MDSFWFYKKALILGTPALNALLKLRVKKGKEDPARIFERKGVASIGRPSGPLVWIHVASVGEAQSVLSLIKLMLSQNPQLNVLVTSVTKTSADLLSTKLPDRAIHQYAPLDHPDWVRKFLDHWHPNLALWVESELWPTMLTFLKKRRIPSALLNAHMSPSSFKNWNRVPGFARKILSAFLVILAQSKQDAEYFSAFSVHNVIASDNIKYAANPLAYDEGLRSQLAMAIGTRPVWLYASTHDGEEVLAANVHKELSGQFPNLLTVIALRHPSRCEDVYRVIAASGLKTSVRGSNKTLPSVGDQVYIVDTMGELGLLYKTVPLTVVGRSFSSDGGGGHNPIEPALLGCAILHGPDVQNLAAIYEEMNEAGAAIKVEAPVDLANTVAHYLTDREDLRDLQMKALKFAQTKSDVLKTVIDELEPVFLEAHLPPPKVLS